MHRAEARAAAEMRDDHAAAGDLRRHLAAAPRRCTRTTARESRSAGCRRSHGCARAAARARRPARWPRWKLVSKQATCGHAGQPLDDGLDGRQVVRLVEGREGNQRRAASPALRGSRSSASVNAAPPWTTRWPTPTTFEPAYCERSQTASASMASRPSLTRSSRRSSTIRVPCVVFARQPRRACRYLRSAPAHSSCHGSSPRRWNTQNFRLDEPALRTSA